MTGRPGDFPSEPESCDWLERERLEEIEFAMLQAQQDAEWLKFREGREPEGRGIRYEPDNHGGGCDCRNCGLR